MLLYNICFLSEVEKYSVDNSRYKEKKKATIATADIKNNGKIKSRKEAKKNRKPLR
jgi:hypothetical protein